MLKLYYMKTNNCRCIRLAQSVIMVCFGMSSESSIVFTPITYGYPTGTMHGNRAGEMVLL